MATDTDNDASGPVSVSAQCRCVSRKAWDLAQVRPIFGRSTVGTTSTCVVYRLLSSALAVLPLAEEGILTAATAADLGYRHLAASMRDIEAKWRLHCSKRADGTPRMTLPEQIDHMRKLSSQVGVTGTKVVCTVGTSCKNKNPPPATGEGC